MRKKLKVRYRKSYRINLKKNKMVLYKKRIVILVCLAIITAILYGLASQTKPEDSSIFTLPEKTLDDDLLFPVEGKVTALEKDGSHENNGAVDIANSEGTPILASMDGKVVYADVKGTYGNCVIVQHNNHLSTLYAHLCEIAVSIDETVAKGQVIGKMGCTGNATGNHLHFEIRVNDQRQNILIYFPFLKLNLNIVREK